MEDLSLSPYHWWAVVAIVLLIAEIFVPGFWLFCVSMGCFAASATAFLGAGLSLQLIVCAAVSLAAFFTLRPLLMKRMWKDNGVRTNVDALVGQRGRVTQDFEAGLRLGRVSVGGDDWRAECVNDRALRVGDVVEVVRVDSNTVIVKPEEQ
ncbi:MAG: NfeD family protein [Flavobacteriales bacterium]|nr:NfeD family protein [Flavobacteriales bacterium]